MPNPESSVLATALDTEEAILLFLTLDTICFLLISILLSILTYKLCFQNSQRHFDSIVISWDFNEEPKEEPLPRRFTVACVLCLVTYLLIYALQFIYFFLIYTENAPTYLKSTGDQIDNVEQWIQQNEHFNLNVAVIDLLSWSLFVITKLLLFIIFIGRLWHSFKTTPYKTKKCVYKTLMISIPLVIILMLFNEVVAFSIDVSSNNSSFFGWNGRYEMMIITSCVLILDAIITLIVLILYYTKLYHLLIAKQRMNRFISGAELELNETQLLFVNKSVKHALLCIIAFSLTQAVWYFATFTYWLNNDALWATLYGVFILNGLITVFCVYLTYKFSDDLYFKMCNGCHQSLFKRCRRAANKKLKRNPIGGNV